ncbi:MAG: YihY/virulence factor BrkB family protein [Opitutaceae bacterium]|nr:YihY/virulence factor BrkB family protein [Opitutaceae bacterium]
MKSLPNGRMKRHQRFATFSRQAWATLSLAAKRYVQIEGAQWAAAFAHYAFFAFFPLILLLATIASLFGAKGRAAAEVISFVEGYVPIGQESQSFIFDTVAGVVESRGPASVIAVLLLIWTVMRLFATLILVTNRAWDSEGYQWWRLPLRSLMLLTLLVTAIALGVALPALAEMLRTWLVPANDFGGQMYVALRYLIPVLLMFLSLSFFYRLAPRRRTRVAEVWLPALCTTALLQVAEALFGVYLRNFATFNAVYGAFGGIMALLLWIYFSGCIFIFGACLCAAQAERRGVAAALDNKASMTPCHDAHGILP